MKKYLKNCKCLFPVYGKHERQYIKHLECHIQEYLAEHDNCTYDDLVTEFGSPSEIVGSYYRSTDNNSLIKKINFVRYARLFMVIVVSAVLLFLGYKSYALYQEYLMEKDASTLYEEITIEDLGPQ
ncbi:hypothetical protein FMM74_004350 [Lachnospiraceae bacterium MD308]|mgnify:FL=1|nr:hypothetical protein [Lachnospiraceae bacterium MD308]MCI8579392.1 hypothetical protein [Dorea sp.]